MKKINKLVCSSIILTLLLSLLSVAHGQEYDYPITTWGTNDRIGITDGNTVGIYTSNFELISTFELPAIKLSDEVSGIGGGMSPNLEYIHRIIVFNEDYISAHSRYLLQIWSATTQQLLFEVRDINTRNGVIWNHQSSQFAIARQISLGGDILLIFDIVGNEVIQLTPPNNGGISRLNWNSDDSYLAFVSVGILYIWDFVGQSYLPTPSYLVNSEVEISFSPVTNDIAFVDLDLSTTEKHSLIVWNPDTTQETTRFESPGLRFFRLDWGLGGIAFIAFDSTIRIWNPNTEQELAQYPKGYIDYLDWSPDGTSIMTDSSFPALYQTITPLTGSVIATFPEQVNSSSTQSANNQHNYFNAPVWHPSQNIIAVTNGTQIRLYPSDFSVILDEYNLVDNPETSLIRHGEMRWSPDGTMLAISITGNDIIPVIQIWNLQNAQLISEIESIVVDEPFSWNSTSTQIATVHARGLGDDVIRIFDVTSEELLQEFAPPNVATIGTLSWSQNESTIAFYLSGENLGTFLLDVDTGIFTQSPINFNPSVAYQLSPTGEFLAGVINWDDVYIQILNTITFQIDEVLVGHTERIRSITWIDNMVVTVGRDETTRFWNPMDGRQIRQLNTGLISVPSFNEEGTLFVSNTDDNIIYIRDSVTGVIIYSSTPPTATPHTNPKRVIP